MAQIHFKGKAIVWNHHLGVEYHELVPDKDKSLTDKVSLNDNLIIHGDNLKALKALLPTYAGKVKCIYIDPPYNTGNEGWVYSDSVSSPMMKEWLGEVVDREDLTRHDKWLCMMTPRLKLLRELLSDDGVVFVSIDEHEIGNLCVLAAEIFGDESYDILVWRKTGKQSNTKRINRVKTSHEYVLVIYKNKMATYLSKVKLLPNWANEYTNPDNDPRGKYKQGIISNKEETSRKDSPNYYSVTLPSGRIVTREWYISEDQYRDLKKDDRIYVPKQGDGIPALKIFQDEEQSYYLDSIIDEMGTFSDAKDEVAEIFGSRDSFDTPKPSKMIRELIRVATKKDDIVLDSFAGSGTTGQAVLELNNEDQGSRKFVLVEMVDGISDTITAERVRRVIKGIPKAKSKNLQKGLGGSFSYFSLGDAIDEVGILSGKKLPSYEQMARYLFYTATGEEFDEKTVNETTNFIGKSKEYEVYLFYKPDTEYLKNTALNLDKATGLPKFNGKRRLVFAPAKYLDQEHLDKYNIDFAQLPFEIYKKAD